jgi:tetratricopeptide (TPR) repeat protein
VEIKYSKKKQEMRSDPVLDFIMKAKDVVVAQSNVIMITALAVVLVLGGSMVYRSIKSSGFQKSQDTFGKAFLAYEASTTGAPNSEEQLSKAIEGFKLVVDNFKSSPQATYSAYLLGHIFLRQLRYDEAITWFNAALTGSSTTGFVGASPLEGLANCYEAKGNREEALGYLRKALLDDRLKYRSAALQWKTALLCRDLKKLDDARSSCQKILADTVAAAAPYRQKAENLLVELSLQEKS